ncbi:hypothetical protein Tco_0352423 [Tanacetum coccineum]
MCRINGFPLWIFIQFGFLHHWSIYWVTDDVNPFGRGNPGFHDDHYDNPLMTKETESEPIIWDIGDEEEEYPFVNKYQCFQEEAIVLVEEESCLVYDTDNKEEEESMSVYDTDI